MARSRGLGDVYKRQLVAEILDPQHVGWTLCWEALERTNAVIEDEVRRARMKPAAALP
jgi:hypothetical protein